MEVDAGEALEMVKFLLVGVNVLLFAMAVTVFVSAPSSRRSLASLSRSGERSSGVKRALLVTAHPDDESMFFLPLLRSLQPSGLEEKKEEDEEWQVHLLVLSRGNFDGLGDVREVEMRKCAEFLGIEADNVRVLEDPKLQDGMQNQWSVDHIAGLVLEYVESKQIDAVFTFDDYGVSGHPNHVSVYRGVKSALRLVQERCDAADDSSTKQRRRVRGWALESTNILRKYIGVLDAPLSFWLTGRNDATPDDSAFVFSFEPTWNYRAMQLHHSQFVWYRRLFVVFSRYTFVNTFHPIVPSGISTAKTKKTK